MQPLLRIGGMALMLMVTGFGCGSPADRPVQVTSQPASGLLLIASLDHSRAIRGAISYLRVELRNTGSAEVVIPRGGPCDPALLVAIRDSGGQIVWAQPVPMCAEQFPPPKYVLASGQSVSGTQCFQWGQSATLVSECPLVTLWAGTYRLAGSFHHQPLPEVDFLIV